MARKIEEIQSEIMALPQEDRARLAKNLMASLDNGEQYSQEEIDDAWKSELKRRLAAVENGTAKLFDGDQVVNELKEKYVKT